MKSIATYSNMSFATVAKRWKLLFFTVMVVSSLISSSVGIDQGAYYQATPCPTNSSLVGYTNITAMNEDVLTHYGESIEFAVPESYHYVLCPDTTFRIQNAGDFIIPATDESTFSCGADGSMSNNCVIDGGTFQVYFLDILQLKDIVFRGLTFQRAQVASVYGDAHPNSMVTFDDCLWQDINTTDVAYIHFTPYQPNRRLTEGGDKYDFERPAVVQKFEAVYNSNNNKRRRRMEQRSLQIDARYSMGVLYKDCIFQEITTRDSIIFNVGGEIGLVGSWFEDNVIDKYALFTTILNGHAYVAQDTMFVNNQAPLGPMFVSYDSFLQYSNGADGMDNDEGLCDSIYIEDAVAFNGPSCIVDGVDNSCNGFCCPFDDETCDVNPDIIVTAAPTPSPTVLSDQTLERPPTIDRAGSSSSEEEDDVYDKMTFNQVNMESSSNQENSNGICTGYCLGFVIVLPLFLFMVFVVLCTFIRRKKQRKELNADTEKAAAAEERHSEMTAEFS